MSTTNKTQTLENGAANYVQSRLELYESKLRRMTFSELIQETGSDRKAVISNNLTVYDLRLEAMKNRFHQLNENFFTQ